VTAKVADDIESLCSKCGPMWHVVVAKVGDKIAKVQCKQCGKLHRYKSPHAESKPKRAPAKKRTKRAKGVVEPPPVEADLSRPIQPYKMTTKFEIGDRVQHPTLGLGVVAELPSPGKMQVSFDGDRKLLVHERDG